MSFQQAEKISLETYLSALVAIETASRRLVKLIIFVAFLAVLQ